MSRIPIKHKEVVAKEVKVIEARNLLHKEGPDGGLDTAGGGDAAFFERCS